ncbi:GNAT family N-acetyltransferase, partial [uncultured Jatrophihabitans sp.]|uniref:GNAT family N-acetyltransferase n=1 Tax=uncultured Jatrophihabitans sp. TaxID=1610747 RepID=UPI0035CA8EBB
DERVSRGVVRLADDDAGELLTLQLAAWVREMHANPGVQIPPLFEDLDDVRSQLADPAQTVWGVREGGRLIATVRTSVREDGTAYVGRLGVVPDLNRQGLGGALLRHAEALLPPTVPRIDLITGAGSIDNHRFYARHGYRIVGPGPAHSTLRMVKDLEPARGLT